MEKKRIIVVDDEEGFVKIVKMNLELTGKYEVMGLSKEKEIKDIVSYLHKFNPHLILLDLVMPDIGGLEVCEMLNDDAFGCRVPLIILSALSGQTDKLKANKLGVVDYLVKPIKMDELMVTIDKAIASRWQSK